MKNWKLLVGIIAFSTVSTGMLFAQKLPKSSPYAEVEQMVGLTEVEIEYSSPAMRNRDVWSELVPMGTLWRAGANECTQLSIDNTIFIDGEALRPGKYALFILPQEGETWEWVINTDTTLWGTSGYDDGKDVIRSSAQVEWTSGEAGPERLIYTIENHDNNGGEIVMRWAGVQLVLPFTVETEKQALENITTALKETKYKDARVLRNSASYMVENGGDLGEALEWIEIAVKIEGESWYTRWVYAEILAALERIEEAQREGAKAIDMGKKQAEEAGREFVYGESLTNEMKNWGSK